MSRILKRPMFRIGGSANDGIMSMAAPRKNYQQGTPYEEKFKEIYPLLERSAGPGPSVYSDFGDLLISGGLNLMSGRAAGRGNLAAVAESFKEPYQSFSKARASEDALKRQLRLAAATQAMTSTDAEKLQKLKQEDKKLFIEKSQLGSKASGIFDLLDDLRWAEKVVN